MPGFWLWFETPAIDISVSWELAASARGRVKPCPTILLQQWYKKLGENVWGRGFIDAHAATVYLHFKKMTGPVTDTAVWREQSLSQEQGDAGVHGFVCLHGSPTARLALPGKGWVKPTHLTGTRQEERAAHPPLLPGVPAGVPRLRGHSFPCWARLHDERKCFNELHNFSVFRKRT